MKKNFFKKSLVVILALGMLASCGLSTNLPTNSNQNTTEVVLSGNNYKVIKQVKGEVKATYVLGIGGNKKRDIIAQSRKLMLEDAELVGKARAIINENVDVHVKYGLFTTKFTITSSGYLIEFID